MINKEKPYLWDNGSGYGSHIEPLLFIFNNIPRPTKGIELGTGLNSTPLLLEKIDDLTSVEMQYEEWYHEVCDKLKPEYPNWKPVLNLIPEAYSNLSMEGVTFALSDGHGSSRPQAVNFFMRGGVETIVGHDTESTWYGWHLVTPEKWGYFSYQFKEKAPYTTVWTKNPQLIQALKNLDGSGKTLVLNQPRGLGDIIFCQTLAHSFKKDGYRVIFETTPEYVEGLNKAYPEMTFMSGICAPAHREVYEKDGTITIPLRFSDSLCGTPYKDCMKTKYWLFDKVWQYWKLHAMWVRNVEREKDLFYNVLGLKDGDVYTLVNENFKGNSRIKIKGNPDVITLSIFMRNIPGFSLFDWAMVIERASEIHTVSTSIIYILELLNIGDIPVHIYKREPDEKDHSYYDYLLTKPNYILE